MQIKHTVIGAVLCTMFTIGYPSDADAFPEYRRLFTKKYRYKVNCALCHKRGGGSALNKYGKAFLKNGESLLAFTQIEDLDVDKDGFTNGVEIKARSHPAKSASTPPKPGTWLDQIEEDLLPLKLLKKAAPNSAGFITREGIINSKQVKFIEKKIKGKLSDADKLPVLYISTREVQGKLMKHGVLIFVRGDGFKLLLNIDGKGKMQHIHVVDAAYRKLKKRKSFWKQYIGKSLEDDFEVGKDITPIPKKEKLCEEINFALKKSLYIVHGVFAKDKKKDTKKNGKK